MLDNMFACAAYTDVLLNMFGAENHMNFTHPFSQHGKYSRNSKHNFNDKIFLFITEEIQLCWENKPDNVLFPSLGL